MPIKHKFTEPQADWTQADVDAAIAAGQLPAGSTPASIVKPSNWNDTHTNPDIADVNNLTSTLAAKADLVGGTVPASQLPAAMRYIQNYANLAGFPATGVADIVYIADDTNKTYRWDGSVYVEISASAVTGSGTTGNLTKWLSSTSLTSATAGTDYIAPAAALTTGSVPFANSTGQLAQDNANLFWDATNKRLGIDTATPQSTLVVGGTQTGNAGFEVAASSGITAQAYNRSTFAYSSLNFDGSPINFRPSGTAALTLATGGLATFAASITANAAGSTATFRDLDAGGGVFHVNSSTGVTSLYNNGPFGWTAAGTAATTIDTIIGRRAAANIRLGNTDAAAPVAQTLSVQSVVAGTTNTAGANLTISGSQGTGTGAGGSIVLQTAPAGSTGSTVNALVAGLTLDGAGSVTIAGNLINQSGFNIDARNGSILFPKSGATPITFSISAAPNNSLQVGSFTVNGLNYAVKTAQGFWESNQALINNLNLSGTFVSGNDAFGPTGWAAVPIRPGQTTGNANNVAGLNLQIQGGQGTGTGNGGDIRLQVKSADGSGSQVLTVLSDALTVSGASATKGNVGIGTTTPTQKLDVNGNIAISALGSRITGDMSNGTQLNRLAFQTSTASSSTTVTVIPSATSANAALNLISTADPTNGSLLQIVMVGGNESRINSNVTGTGTALPLGLYVAGSRRLALDTVGTMTVNELPNIQITSSTAGIDGKTVAGTLAYTNSTGKTLIVNGATIRCTAASSITNGPTVAIGTTNGGTDIFAAQAINALTTTSKMFWFTRAGMSVIVPNGGTVYVNVTAAATGTSQTIAADIEGYFV